MLGHQAYWAEQRETLKSEYRQLLGQFPDADADAQLKQLFKVLCDIENVAEYTPAPVGESEKWSSIVNVVEEKRQNFCKALTGKTLFTALYGTYTVALQELKTLLKVHAQAGQSKTTEEDGFKDVRRRKRHSSKE
jgi:hypothetical protein